jgi:hypothetical protein
MSLMPVKWVVRQLTERDYGIDPTIELFVPQGKDKNGHQAYGPTVLSGSQSG